MMKQQTMVALFLFLFISTFTKSLAQIYPFPPFGYHPMPPFSWTPPPPTPTPTPSTPTAPIPPFIFPQPPATPTIPATPIPPFVFPQPPATPAISATPIPPFAFPPPPTTPKPPSTPTSPVGDLRKCYMTIGKTNFICLGEIHSSLISGKVSVNKDCCDAIASSKTDCANTYLAYYHYNWARAETAFCSKSPSRA